MLWLLRTKKDPQPEGRRRDRNRTGQDRRLILTENTQSAEPAPLEAALRAGRPAPALPPPGPSLTLESSDAGGGCGSEDELWTDGSGEAGVRIRSRQEQAPLLLPAQAVSKGSAFLSHRLLPSVPEAGGQDLHPVQGMGF